MVMAGATKRDLRMLVFTSKTCGHCIELKKSGLIGEFKKKHPEVEVVELDGDSGEAYLYADALKIEGFPWIGAVSKLRGAKLANLADAPTMERLEKMIEKAIEKLNGQLQKIAES
jgi:glutaredoxin